jgi:hypothetical protein
MDVRHAGRLRGAGHTLSLEGMPASRRSNRGGFHSGGPRIICSFGSIRSCCAGSAPPGCLAGGGPGTRSAWSRTTRCGTPHLLPSSGIVSRKRPSEQAGATPTRIAFRSQYKYSIRSRYNVSLNAVGTRACRAPVPPTAAPPSWGLPHPPPVNCFSISSINGLVRPAWRSSAKSSSTSVSQDLVPNTFFVPRY